MGLTPTPATAAAETAVLLTVLVPGCERSAGGGTYAEAPCSGALKKNCGIGGGPNMGGTMSGGGGGTLGSGMCPGSRLKKLCASSPVGTGSAPGRPGTGSSGSRF